MSLSATEPLVGTPYTAKIDKTFVLPTRDQVHIRSSVSIESLGSYRYLVFVYTAGRTTLRKHNEGEKLVRRLYSNSMEQQPCGLLIGVKFVRRCYWFLNNWYGGGEELTGLSAPGPLLVCRMQ